MSQWEGVYWKGGKNWCKCCGTRPEYCPNYKKRGEKKTEYEGTYQSGGKDWCHCHGTRPHLCPLSGQNRKYP